MQLQPVFDITDADVHAIRVPWEVAQTEFLIETLHSLVQRLKHKCINTCLAGQLNHLNQEVYTSFPLLRGNSARLLCGQTVNR